MASDLTFNNFLSGTDLIVQIDEIYDNFLTVINKKIQLKGILFPISIKNDVIFDKLLKECKELNDKNYDKNKNVNSAFCVADSTLSHNSVDNSIENIDNSICAHCKKSFKKVPKTKKSTTVSKEVAKLTKHGFNEDVFKMKNASPRRGTYRGTYRLTSEKLTLKAENFLKNEEMSALKQEDKSSPKQEDKSSPKQEDKSSPKQEDKSTPKRKYKSALKQEDKSTPKRKYKSALKQEDEAALEIVESDVNINISRPKGLAKFTKNRIMKVATRPTSERALKTRANEKIIDLCTKRKSLKVIKVEEPLEVEVDEKKPKLSTPIISDASIYDFVDEDCESEPIPKSRSHFFSLKTTRRQRSTTDVSQDPNDLDAHSNPGVTHLEHDGTKFCINDIVWAKIPGYPFWPAHINSFDNINLSKTCGKRCRISWIGWDQQSFLPLKSLLHFKNNFAKKYSPKLKSIKYKTAIGLACKELGLDFDEIVSEAMKKSPDRSSGSYGRRKSINLDEIFNCRGENTGSLFEFEMNQDTCYDEDTDEEEKARSALITAESLEANSKLSGLISRAD